MRVVLVLGLRFASVCGVAPLKSIIRGQFRIAFRLPLPPKSFTRTMSLLGMYSQERERTTTQWDDIQRKLGNLPPLEPRPGDLQAQAEELADQLGVFEPDKAAAAAVSEAVDAAYGGGQREEEEEELARLRAQRKDELIREHAEGPYGTVAKITHAQFMAEVNQVGEGVGVVVLLCKKGHYASSYMLVLLEKLARKFRRLKIVQIGSTECIPDYPDRNLPTLLLYRDDDLLGQLVGTVPYGGSSYGLDDVEWELAQHQLVETDLGRNPHEQPHR